MSTNVVSLERILVEGRMRREIERQKGQKPRWSRPMFFRTASQAAGYVRALQAKRPSGYDAGRDPWQDVADLMSMTHHLFASADQADQVAFALLQLVRRHCPERCATTIKGADGVVELTAHLTEIEIVFGYEGERQQKRFERQNEGFVPVPW